ncbi:DUF5067 domain-containing protein [uncultured Secundilactobacillus sp.]|uniref:DUF5067 domain-containing protein n=1 Tax=uncultured Secundilactobacillus sp. TaxID=2813935 RepID=UPI002582D703|nr:DUF5067 domain-containing protein [uncultured Secundilactobacillus sp.]
MRKVVTMGATILATLTLAACGSKSADSSKDSSSDNNTHTVKTEKKTDRSFENNVLKLNDMTVKITKTSVIPVGNKGNEYSKKPVFAIWFDVTNTSDKKLTPVDVVSVLQATQEGKNTDRKLDVGYAPDQKMVDIQSDSIKKGKTSKGAIAWELIDTKTPVVLTATTTTDNSEVGHQTYNIK